MAAYREIQGWVRRRYVGVPKPRWIAHCKELSGLPHRDAPSRRNGVRAAPRPPEKRPPLFDAFRRLGML